MAPGWPVRHVPVRQHRPGLPGTHLVSRPSGLRRPNDSAISIVPGSVQSGGLALLGKLGRGGRRCAGGHWAALRPACQGLVPASLWARPPGHCRLPLGGQEAAYVTPACGCHLTGPGRVAGPSPQSSPGSVCVHGGALGTEGLLWCMPLAGEGEVSPCTSRVQGQQSSHTWPLLGVLPLLSTPQPGKEASGKGAEGGQVPGGPGEGGRGCLEVGDGESGMVGGWEERMDLDPVELLESQGEGAFPSLLPSPTFLPSRF